MNKTWNFDFIAPARCRALLAPVVICSLLAAPLPAQAQGKHAAHVHGVAKADVAVQGNKLSVQLELPLDSLVGFEHRPRTDAQRRAAQAAVQQLKGASRWLQPDAAAQCTLTSTQIDAQALEPAPPGAKTAEGGHADLEASYEFTCAAPDKLLTVDIGLAEVFKRIERIEVQVAGAKTQSKQTLRKPAKQVRLVR